MGTVSPLDDFHLSNFHLTIDPGESSMHPLSTVEIINNNAKTQ